MKQQTMTLRVKQGRRWVALAAPVAAVKVKRVRVAKPYRNVAMQCSFAFGV